jgi:hypothetical protein
VHCRVAGFFSMPEKRNLPQCTGKRVGVSATAPPVLENFSCGFQENIFMLGEIIMTEKETMDVVYDILEKKQGLTEAEIANNWFESPIRPSEKHGLIVDALIELIQNRQVFFECEGPSIKTLIYGPSPYRFFTKNARSENRII